MKLRAVLIAVIVLGSLVIPTASVSAFTFGSYCIKLSSPGIKWQAPKVGVSEVYNFEYVNTCQKTIPSFQVDFAEDISGGSFSQWNTISEIFTAQDIVAGERGKVQITFSYAQYISTQNKIYLRSVESESELSGGGTNTTNNVSVQQVTFSATASSNNSPTSTILKTAWDVESKVDDFGSLRVIAASYFIPGVGTSNSFDEANDYVHFSLYVRCQDKKLEVYVNTPRLVDNSTSALVKFGNGSAKSWPITSSTDNEAIFFGRTATLISSMVKTSKFYLRASGPKGYLTANFNTVGLISYRNTFKKSGCKI